MGATRVTNRNGRLVHLLASPGLAQERGGLGWRIKQKLAERLLPMVTTLGDGGARVMVLVAKEIGRLPGSLVRDTKAEFGSVAGEKTSRVTTLEVQSHPAGA